MVEMLGTLIHAINLILILILLFIYLQNYRKLKTKMTIGLVLFTLFFLAQSIMNLYFDATMTMYSSTPAETAAIILEAVRAVGFAILVWISWE